MHNLLHKPQRLLEMADLAPHSVAIGPLNTAQTGPAGLPQGSKCCAHLLSRVVAPVQAVLTQVCPTVGSAQVDPADLRQCGEMLPDSLSPPQHAVVAAVFAARGTENYTCM